MGVKDFFEDLRDKYITQSSANISVGENRDAFSFSSESAGRVDLKDLEKVYTKCPPVFAAINLYSESIFGKGWLIRSEDEKAKKHCEKVLNLSSFKPTAVAAVSNTLLYGGGFQEIIWDSSKKDIVGFGNIDPKTMRKGMKWDKHGQIYRFDQIVGTEVKAKFDIFDEATGKRNPTPKIAYYRFFRVGDSVWGIGLIEPAMKDIEVYMDMKLAIAEIIAKFANPLIHVTKTGAKSEKDLTDMEDKLKDLNRKTFFATSERIKVDLVESARAIPSLRSQYDMIIDSLVSALRTPKAFLFGKGESGTWGATMNAFMAYSMFEIALFQGKLTEIIQDQIFKPLCLQNNYKDVPYIEWNPLMEIDELNKANSINLYIEAIKKAKEVGLIDAKKANDLFEKQLERW